MQVQAIQTQLRQQLTAYFSTDGGVASEAAVELAFRTRLFLDELDCLTDWRTDHPRRTFTAN